MDKLLQFFIKLTNGEFIAVDKMLHFAFSYMIASFFTNPLIGITVILIAGITKEVFDKYKKKTKFDFTDLLAGLAGAGFYLLTQTILQ